MRSSRDNPEPLSSARWSMGNALRCRNDSIASADFAGVEGRAARHGADAQEQVARHRVVAELVDVANDVRQHRALMRRDQARVGRHLAFACGAAERAAGLAPQREEAAGEKRRMIKDGDVD